MKRKGSGSEFTRGQATIMATTAALITVVAGIASASIPSVEVSVALGQSGDVEAAGAKLLDTSDATAREELVGDVHDVHLQDGVVYVAIDRSIVTFDVSDPRHPLSLGQFDLDTAPRRITVAGDRLFVNRFDGVQVLLVSDPRSPVSIGFSPFPAPEHGEDAWTPDELTTPPSTSGIVVDGALVVATQQEPPALRGAPSAHYRIGVIDPADGLPRWTETPILDTCCGPHLQGTKLIVGPYAAYRMGGFGGIIEYDLNDPAAPAERWRMEWSHPRALAVDGDRIALGAVTHGESSRRVEQAWQYIFDGTAAPTPVDDGKLMYGSHTEPYLSRWSGDTLWWLDRPAKDEDGAPRLMAATHAEGRLRAHGDAVLEWPPTALSVEDDLAIVGMGSDLSAITLFTLGADGRSLERLGTLEPGVPDFGPLPFGIRLPWAGTGR